MNKALNKYALKVPLNMTVVNANSDIEWSFVGYDESDHASHELVKVSDTVIAVKPTMKEYLFRMLLLIAGSAFIGFTMYKWNAPDFFLYSWAKWFMLFFGLLLAVGGGLYPLLKYLFVYKKRFSKDNNDYLIGRKNVGNLTDIGALQLLYKRHAYHSFTRRSNNSNIFSYQMNVVMSDKQRLNVMTHGDLKQMRADAELLSAFLGVEIIDAIP